MSTESPAFINHNHETEHLRETNSLQIFLAERRYPNMGSDGESIMKWTTEGGRKYSKKFREFLDAELDFNVNFWEDLKNTDFYNSFVERVEEILYGDDMVE